MRGSLYHQAPSLTIDMQIIDVETGMIVSSLRAEGVETDIPRLEHDLVTQLVSAFHGSLGKKNVLLNQREEAFQEYGWRDDTNKTTSFSRVESGSFGIHSVHQIDVGLSLERIAHQRVQADRTADAFWQKGWSAEIGQPNYDIWQSSAEVEKPMPVLILPVSLFMQQNNILDVLQAEGKGGTQVLADLESEGLVGDSDVDRGVSQVFFESIRRPRRMFVRALNEQGVLVAIFSKWSWQTDRILQKLGDDSIRFPLWPQPFMSGVAEFPVTWVERGEQHVNFDVVIVL